MLMFSPRAVAHIGWPLACSGQNQAYRKSLFKKVGGYQKISHLLMGDDSIFLQLCIKHGAKVKFCKNFNSYVFCRSEKNWKDCCEWALKTITNQSCALIFRRLSDE